MKEFIDKLIERLEELKKENVCDRIFCIECHEKYGDCDNALPFLAYDNAMEIVNQLAEEYKGGWIPCSERLPEISNWYLVTVEEPHETFMLYFDTYDNDWTDFNCITINNVIAWQPLPQPYGLQSEADFKINESEEKTE